LSQRRGVPISSIWRAERRDPESGRAHGDAWRRSGHQWIPVRAGRQDALVNGLPPELARKFQYVFAPELAGKPVVQGAEKGLAVEDIIGLKPEGATPDIRW